MGWCNKNWFYEVTDDGIYYIERTLTENNLPNEWSHELRHLIIPKDILIAALRQWDIIEK